MPPVSPSGAATATKVSGTPYYLKVAKTKMFK